jgi:ABC-2 type transport system ATP-binding protein
MVRSLRATGVTIILTTHYIEEAEEMADRVGVIDKGEIILVEQKTVLMERLGKKQLVLLLERPLESVPAELAEYKLELANDGLRLTYTFHAHPDGSTVAELFRKLAGVGIGFKDVHSRESSLEDIFVSLLRSRP